VRLALPAFLTFAFVMAFAERPKSTYVPIKCMTRFVISDWGKCTLKDGRMDCPNTHTSFNIGCESAKDEGANQGQLTVNRPTAAIVEQ
jgi:hypothetical protein